MATVMYEVGVQSVLRRDRSGKREDLWDHQQGFDKQEHGARDREGENRMRRMSDELINGSSEFGRMEMNEKKMYGGNREEEKEGISTINC